MLYFLHQRLQEICGNQQPFGGMNMLLFGDLHQLQPVKDGWIFESVDSDYGSLAPNIFTDHFHIFELTEIMRQKEDKSFAETLNRLRTASHTDKDIDLLQSRLITRSQSLLMPDIPHFYTTNKNKDEYNQTIMEQSDGKIDVLYAIDTVSSDLPKSEQQKVLAAAKVKPQSAAGNLPFELTVKEGLCYDITANIRPDDGLVNGAECVVKLVDSTIADNLPICIWVKFASAEIGSSLRKTVAQQFKQFTQKKWTPIAPIQRTFVASRSNIKVTRLQFPLQMSAGRTIHKAQSATHEKIVVDMSGPEKAPQTFWEHMHYVAFSRCTSLHGLHIININEPKLRASSKVINFLENEKKELQLCYQPSYQATSHFTVAFNNVGSILRKWKAMENNFNMINSGIIIIVETWLSSQLDENTCVLQGFTQLRMDSKFVTAHRGLLMYICDTLEYVVTFKEQTPELEIIGCSVTKGNCKWNVLGVYKQPLTSKSRLLQQLQKHLSHINLQEPLMMLGDFNIDIHNDPTNRFLVDMEEKFNLEQVLQDSSTWEGTQIDMVFSNIPNTKAYALTNTWSKHHTLFAQVPM